MMCFAERDHVSKVGSTAVFPWLDVVDAAVVERNGAVGVGAGAVEGAEGSSLGSGGGAVFASDVEEFAVAVEDDGDDVGVAAKSADRGHRDWDTVGEFADGAGVWAVEEGDEVDVDVHVGYRGL
jgi:hypothetical protein